MENTKMMFNRGYSMEICSKSRVLASVFSDRYESLWRRRKILDPRGTAIHKWNIMFLTSCFVALFIDPLFFISAVMRRRQKCVDFGVSVQLALAAVRSAADAFYAFQIFVRFHTAYVAPSSLVFGTGDLVVNRAMIASRYLRSGFFLDLIAALPLPQVLMGVTWPSSFHRRTKFKNASRFTVLIQYIPRMYLALRLSSDIVKSAGVVTVRSWPGAFYNLLLYMLASHVPLFEQLDERTLDAICERLKPGVRTEGTYLVREGDPVHEMLFIVRGRLDSTTTNGGRSGFFNICKIGPGDFCGEELLTWALQHRPSPVFPSSTRTVCSLSEVETFALCADDLAFVTTQFRHLHSKQLRHRLRFYSHQWRTWAACFIQAAWRRLIRRRCTTILSARDDGVTEVAITTVIEPLPNSTTLMKPKEVDFSGGQ